MNAGEETGLVFYSAGGDLESAPAGLPSADSPAFQPETPVRKTRKSAKPTGTLSGGGGGGEKPKRVTAASLAASMDQMMQVVPTLSTQIQELSQRYQVLEERIAVPNRASALGLSRPLSSTMGPKAIGAGAVASALAAPPPRTTAQGPLGMLASPKFQPEELQALEEEKEPQQPEGDLARAVLAQSQALTALVSQISQSGQDPMLDLSSSSSSTSTRGAAGRAKLQAELATHSGNFFNAVLRSMARRMQPTTPVSGSAEDLLNRGRLRDAIYGKIWGVRPAPGFWPYPVPDYDSHGLSASWEHWSCQGLHCPFGSLYRPGCTGRGPFRPCGSPDASGGPTFDNLPEQTAEHAVKGPCLLPSWPINDG